MWRLWLIALSLSIYRYYTSINTIQSVSESDRPPDRPTTDGGTPRPPERSGYDRRHRSQLRQITRRSTVIYRRAGHRTTQYHHQSAENVPLPPPPPPTGEQATVIQSRRDGSWGTAGDVSDSDNTIRRKHHIFVREMLGQLGSTQVWWGERRQVRSGQIGSGQVSGACSPVPVQWQAGWGPGRDPPVSGELGATPPARTGCSPEHLYRQAMAHIREIHNSRKLHGIFARYKHLKSQRSWL